MPMTDEVEAADLEPDRNPAIAEDEVPDVLKEGEDTETEATKDREGDEVEPETEFACLGNVPFRPLVPERLPSRCRAGHGDPGVLSTSR